MAFLLLPHAAPALFDWQRSLLFVHVPKAGGSAIEDAMLDQMLLYRRGWADTPAHPFKLGPPHCCDACARTWTDNATSVLWQSWNHGM